MSIERTEEEWKKVDTNIEAELIVPGMYMLKIPSLGKFTNVLKNLAINAKDTKLLTISGYSEVQVRISFKVESEKEFQLKKKRISQMYGVTEKFDYKLPTIGEGSQSILPHFCSFAVKATQLLSVIREIESNSLSFSGVNIDQIYDFWG